MTGFERAAVIGLGLIGGSVARELAAAGVRVSGYDADEAELRAALREGVLADALPPSFEGIEDADLIVLAVPVDAGPEVLGRIAARTAHARLITDVGSTKAQIVSAASRLGLGERFVGAHPLAGDHRSGWSASRLGLFTGARVYLCACPETTSESVALASELWKSVGADPLRTCAEEHDRRMAWTSHMPHMTSIALASVFADAGIPRADLGPGARDLTRLAGSSVDMWTAVARENHAPIAEALLALERQVAALRATVEARDGDGLARALARAREWFAGTTRDASRT